VSGHGPTLRRCVKDKLPDARLFPKMKRNAAWYQHDAVTTRLGFTGYQLRDSRHSYAVRAVKAGTPSEIVAKQLGHKDASMVHKVYGRFQPSSGEREKWERIAAYRTKPKRSKNEAAGYPLCYLFENRQAKWRQGSTLVGLAHPLNPGAGVSWQALSPFSLWRCATVRYPALRKYLHPTTRAATPTLPDSDRRRTPE
jgi:hypothetical protein